MENYLKFEFPKQYRSLKSMSKISMIPTHLKGIEEVRNGESKIHYIGDNEKAEKWISKYKKVLANENDFIKKLK